MTEQGEGIVVLRREEILRSLNSVRMQRKGFQIERKGSIMERSDSW